MMGCDHGYVDPNHCPDCKRELQVRTADALEDIANQSERDAQDQEVSIRGTALMAASNVFQGKGGSASPASVLYSAEEFAKWLRAGLEEQS